MTDCERVLKILKDGKPHMNFDIMNMLGGGFAVAARIWDLRKIDGKYKLNIKYGSPKEFGKVRQREGEWWYQLIRNESKQQTFTKNDFATTSPFAFNARERTDSPLTMATIQASRKVLDRILA